MTRLRIFGLAAFPAVCAALITAAPALANNQQGHHQRFRCENQVVPAITIVGDLVVPSGAFCELVGTHVTGDATVEAGPPEPGLPTGLTIEGATIDEDVNVQHNAQFAAFAASMIGGDVKCNRCEVADVHDSTVQGDLDARGVSEGAFIRNSHIGGNLEIVHGTDFLGIGFHIDGNTIGENLVFNQNTGPSDIFGNTIEDNLTCNHNTPPPVGGGNTARHKEGQCALL